MKPREQLKLQVRTTGISCVMCGDVLKPGAHAIVLAKIPKVGAQRLSDLKEIGVYCSACTRDALDMESARDAQ